MSLTSDAVAARKAGMSYGKYMAQKYIKQKRNITGNSTSLQSKMCPVCRDIFETDDMNVIFCSDYCKYRYDKAREAKEYKERKKAQALAEVENG